MHASQDRPLGLVWTVAAWALVGAAVAVVIIGMVNLYPDPAALRIEAFSRLYERLGLGDILMITLLLVLPFGIAVVSAAVILVRRPRDRSAVLLAVGLVALYLFVSGAAVGLQVEWVRNLATSTAVVILSWFLVGFPTASFVPRWGAIAPIAAVVITVVDPSFAARLRELLTNPGDPASGKAALVLIGVFGTTIAAQVVRYRRHSSRVERYQTRWVLAGLVLMLAPPSVALGLASGGATAGLAGWLVLASALGSLFLPAAVFVAVFRYHLYDLDRLVSRTVTYGVVAVVVALAYAIPVLVLPTVLGQGSQIVVAGATLTAAAAFGPARRRIQQAADRRFNRTRYDATREVERLSARLSGRLVESEVAAEVVGAISRTVQPASVGLWLSGETRRSRPS